MIRNTGLFQWLNHHRILRAKIDGQPIEVLFYLSNLKTPALVNGTRSLFPLSILRSSCDPLIEATSSISCRLVNAPIGSRWSSFFASLCIPSNLVHFYFWFFFRKLLLGYQNRYVHMNRELEVPECLCPLRQPYTMTNV